MSKILPFQKPASGKQPETTYLGKLFTYMGPPLGPPTYYDELLTGEPIIASSEELRDGIVTVRKAEYPSGTFYVYGRELRPAEVEARNEPRQIQMAAEIPGADNN